MKKTLMLIKGKNTRVLQSCGYGDSAGISIGFSVGMG